MLSVRASPDLTGHSSDLKSVFIATQSFEEHCLKFDVGTSGQVILYVAVQEEALAFCLVNMKLHRGDKWETKFELTLDQCADVTFNPDRWDVKKK